MEPRRSKKLSGGLFTRTRWLSVAVITSLSLLSALFLATLGSASLQRFNSQPPNLQPSGLLITVNTTGDGDALNPNTDCDTDAGTAGEQCTLRAAIQRVNAVAGDDTITFNILTSQPNCDAGTGKCVINLTKALPDLSTNIALNGPGTDNLTVRRDTGGDYGIFTVTTTGAVSFSGVRIENGNVPLGNGGVFPTSIPAR